MAKNDLRHANCSIPIHLDNYQATGCKWQFSGDQHFTYFNDTRSPFGAKSSPEIFHLITQSVRCMMARRGFTDIIVHLDDFLIIGATQELCQLVYDTLLQLLLDLGFSISYHKLVAPTQHLTFLGIQLDTTACTMTLPADKLAQLLELVLKFQHKQRATKKQLQRLAGKLNWACRMVYGGRTFPRRILDITNALSPSGKFRLDKSFRDDIIWWVNFLKVFNDTRLFFDDLPPVDVFTDACFTAAGGYFREDWFYDHFALDSLRWRNLHINHKESLAILLAAKRWCKLWSNRRMVIYSDNQAAV